MKISLNEVADTLLLNDNILILTHKNPDGDTQGSAIALCLALKSRGKRAYILANEGTTPRFKARLMSLEAPEDFAPDFVVAVDSATEERLCLSANNYLGKVDLAVDHHISHKEYAKKTYVGDNAACGEIIWEIITLMGVEITDKIAEALYIAISTDTSCFLNANTSARTHEIVSKFFSMVPNVPALHREFFVVKSKARLAVESLLIASISFHLNGAVAVMKLTLEDIKKTGASEDDLDNIVALARSIDGVELGILLRETTDSGVKASLRSSDKFNSSDICAVFGGGGHVRAAGATIAHISLDMAEDAIIKALGDM
ncbi:MAG: DHH family phosphoesterase [Clostridia bacterium]|nr:DHH family phosphoesterase [Clostridia bacterium]